MRVGTYKNGVLLDFGKQSPCNRKGGGKRGVITGSSLASFRRLRVFCITHDCLGDCWGVTLTIPGLSLVRLEYVQNWLHNITQMCNYRRIPLIWRAELQRRGQAHFHMVVYGSITDCLYLCLAWQRQVQKAGKTISIERVGSDSDCVWINRAFVRGSNHMFDIQKLSGDFRSWRYLVAHQSKGKSAQLGWTGRQWGVLQRSSFCSVDCNCHELTDSQMYAVRRWVRRLTRSRRINSVGRHYLLVCPQTIDKMVSYVQELYPSSIPF